MVRILAFLILLCAALSAACTRPHSAAGPEPGASPVVGAPSPTALAARVLERFASSSPEAFDSVYPFERGRGLVGYAARRGIVRRPGVGRVVWTGRDRAVLLLSGHIEFGNSGDETLFSEGFSGLYEARRTAGAWRLSRQIPLDSLARIPAQHLGVTLVPGQGLRVIDTLDIDVETPYGFAARLNHAARLSSVLLDGRPARYEFGGGLLWVRTPRPGRARLVLDYEINVARDSATNANSGRFAGAFGHVRNQYYWHPRGVGWSVFTVTVHAPAEVHVATDLPQTDTVFGGVRSVRACTQHPTFALSLVYDRGWQPVVRRIGPLRLALFTTPDFAPGPDSLASAFARVYRLLSERFGEPASDYFVIAQQRARPGSGWLWRSNEMIGAASQGGNLLRRGPPPRAPFGHEVAHGWVSATGPASNFLGEGWAMLAESVLLEDAFGPDVLPEFWEHRRNLYLIQGFEGRISVLEDPENSGVAYTKGAWILRMLRDLMGEEAFGRGMREYMRISPGEPAGIEEFAAALSRAAGRDVWPFLRPWVEEKVTPDVTARVEGERVILVQHGPVFQLPLEVELVTTSGPVRRTVHLSTRENTLEIGGLGPVTDVRIDPDHRLLLRRHRGEMVRFELRSPGAKEVKLVGDFHREPFPVTSRDGIWTITVPLTEGRYLYHWLVDGKEVEGGVRLVRPAERIESPYPR
jgi:hypothetical protein